jgi:hypothetical protein
MIGEGDCGAFGGMKIGRGNRSTQRKPAPAPLCPPQIPLDQTRDRTQGAAVGSQRLTAWAMARPEMEVRSNTDGPSARKYKFNRNSICITSVLIRVIEILICTCYGTLKTWIVCEATYINSASVNFQRNIHLPGSKLKKIQKLICIIKQCMLRK